jgi:hypothetical protein
MRDGAQILKAVPLLLQRVVRRALPLHQQFGQCYFKRLFCPGREFDGAFHAHRRADAQRRGFREVRQAPVRHQLHILDRAAVAEF